MDTQFHTEKRVYFLKKKPLIKVMALFLVFAIGSYFLKNRNLNDPLEHYELLVSFYFFQDFHSLHRWFSFRLSVDLVTQGLSSIRKDCYGSGFSKADFFAGKIPREQLNAAIMQADGLLHTSFVI
ncbi:hypothetical protein [Cohaesibacter haloalkalitolerans]|uniref:hypothetical protein n=1 Tax=Cohaesibacter haloalkalitolerans TaxID=1162980 RepID=UPI000E64A8FD|nr:hypothetical protein [Cohaesibacter haloalkalitolerans]